MHFIKKKKRIIGYKGKFVIQPEMSRKLTRWPPLPRACRADTHLNDPFHHAHHLVDHSNGLVGALCRADVGPVLAGQHVPARHVQHIRG